MLKEPKDAPKWVKRNEMEGQSCLTLKLLTVELKKEKRGEISILKWKRKGR